MNLTGTTALVTGASSGIGEACARALAAAGARLIVTARRIDRLERLAAELRTLRAQQVLPIQIDVRDRHAVTQCFQTLPDDFRQIDILVNNAGLSRGLDKVHTGAIDDWEEMIDTNVKGLLYVTRAVVPGMVARGRGHIVNIGSIAGRQTYPNGNVYCASKAAVRAISEGLKLDLTGTGVRVTEVQPGLVNTEFSAVRFHGDQARADKTYEGMTPLSAADVADIVLFAVTRPAHVNISEILVVPTDQSSTTLVHRRSPASA
jgi:3-hydroxy acid dehydrogenase/malonic semialdehyde reductase